MSTALRAQLADYFERLLLLEEMEQTGEEIADRVLRMVAASQRAVSSDWEGGE